MDGWMDGWMDFEDGEDGGGRRERVKTRLNDAYRLFAPRFQIRQISKSDPGRVIISKSKSCLSLTHGSRNHTFELLAIGACPKMMRQLVRTYTMW